MDNTNFFQEKREVFVNDEKGTDYDLLICYKYDFICVNMCLNCHVIFHYVTKKEGKGAYSLSSFFC